MHSRHIFIGYPVTFEIWHCSDLESLHDVLSIKRKSGHGGSADSEWSGRVVRVIVVHGPRRTRGKDPFPGDRPIICVL